MASSPVEDNWPTESMLAAAAFSAAAAAAADGGMAGVRLLDSPPGLKAVILRVLLDLGVGTAEDLWTEKNVEGKDVAAHIFR